MFGFKPSYLKTVFHVFLVSLYFSIEPVLFIIFQFYFTWFFHFLRLCGIAAYDFFPHFSLAYFQRYLVLFVCKFFLHWYLYRLKDYLVNIFRLHMLRSSRFIPFMGLPNIFRVRVPQ